MKTLLALTLITGLAFTGVCEETNKANGTAQIQQEQLFTRTYKITTEFEGNLKRLAGTKEGESQQEMLLRYFKRNDIKIASTDKIFLSKERNMLFVRTTEAKQDKIERLVGILQQKN